jgi:hypothetical protein
MWALLERALDAIVLAALVGVAASTPSRFERAALLTAAALLLIGWVVAWRRRR